MSARRIVIHALVVVLLAAASLAAVSTATAADRVARAVDHLVLTTKQVAVAPATAPKPKPKPKPKAPICKKGQRSTKKKPCRKRKPQAVGVAANPPVAGWTFGISLFQQADGWTLSLAYNHAAGNARESHSYLFSLTPDAVTAAPDLSTLTINTGVQMGQFGAVQMSLSNVGALSSANPFPGCTTGLWQMRSGTLSGTLTFVAGGTYFKTLMETSLPADLSANTSGVAATCGTNPGICAHESVIYGGGTGSGVFEAFSSGDQTTMLFFQSQKQAPATITDFLQVTGLPGSDATLASDVSSGAVATDGASPYFTGSLTFTRTGTTTTGANATCGGTPISFAQGALTGSLVAHFIAIPEVTVPLSPAGGQVF